MKAVTNKMIAVHLKAVHLSKTKLINRNKTKVVDLNRVALDNKIMEYNQIMFLLLF